MRRVSVPIHGARLAGVVAVVLVTVVVFQAVASAGQTPAASSGGTRTGADSCKNIKKGGTLVYGVTQDVVSFDAANTQDNGSLWADMNVYQQLVRLTPDGSKLVGDLAQSWDVKKGGRVVVFHLRHNARFNDGSQVTAADAKFSFDRTRSPKSVVNWTLEAVKSDRVVDKYTFEVTLKKPWAPFLNDISLWGASIMSQKAVKRLGAKIKSQPVSSGPFSVADFKPGQYVLLKRNPYYWQKDSCGNRYPYLDAVRLQYLPNDSTRMAKLQAGAIDAAVDVPYNQIKSIGRVPHLKTVTSTQMGQISIELSQGFAPFRDQKVVQAMNYAIDREAIVKAVFFGHATAATSPIDPGVYFSSKKYGYQYNLAKAKQLMKEAGVTGFQTTLLTVSGDSISSGIGVILQNELKQIGIDVKLQALDGTTEFGRMQKKQFDMAYIYGTSDNLDPNANMLFCCVSDGGAFASYTDWKSPQADALFRKTQTTVNFAQRAKLFNAWQKIVMEEGPHLWLVNPTNRFAYRDNVHGFFIQNTAHWPLWVVWKS
jgi:peptide/nickel transport system substrate-binding protein